MQTTQPHISEREFEQFRQFILKATGISMSPAKRPLVGGRLAKRLKQRGLDSYGDYFKLLDNERDAGEVQIAIDLLTTNETSFFRERKHFDFLQAQLATGWPGKAPLRIWSAASSSGEEAYSLAMLLSDQLADGQWEVHASDISTRVLERARLGRYAIERSATIPKDYLKRFCLRGTGPEEGAMLIKRSLRQRVSFQQVNLNAPLPQLGMFDAIFLRNVMIYFNEQTKREVVTRVLAQLKPGGFFFIGHSESLQNVASGLETIAPSVFRKPGA
ncbi:MAG: protein-glutamate O-methyltransferase CheR [Rhodocyclaceae bacterium]